MKMKGGQITQAFLDRLSEAERDATSLATKLDDIAKSLQSVGGTKKRKMRTKRRKTMKH
jgi:hypothetical protein